MTILGSTKRKQGASQNGRLSSGSYDGASWHPWGNANATDLMYRSPIDHVSLWQPATDRLGSAGPVHSKHELSVELLKATKISVSHLSFETFAFFEGALEVARSSSEPPEQLSIQDL